MVAAMAFTPRQNLLKTQGLSVSVAADDRLSTPRAKINWVSRVNGRSALSTLAARVPRATKNSARTIPASVPGRFGHTIEARGKCLTAAGSDTDLADKVISGSNDL
jgi:hypothetical protein